MCRIEDEAEFPSVASTYTRSVIVSNKRDRIRKALLEYCGQHTLAIVRLLENRQTTDIFKNVPSVAYAVAIRAGRRRLHPRYWNWYNVVAGRLTLG